MNIVIRQANVEDATALQKMAVAAYYQHFRYLWTVEGLEDYLSRHYDTASFLRFIEDKKRNTFLAIIDGQIAGFLIDHQEKSFDDQSEGYYIHRIYLLAIYAGHGIGQRLMETAYLKAKSLGKRYLWLEVMQSSSESIQFYKKRGFHIVREGRFDLLPMKNRQLEKMFVMKKEITQP